MTEFEFIDKIRQEVKAARNKLIIWSTIGALVGTFIGALIGNIIYWRFF